jgi:hypothetical protein
LPDGAGRDGEDSLRSERHRLGVERTPRRGGAGRLPHRLLRTGHGPPQTPPRFCRV